MLTINNTLDGYLKDVEIKGNTVQDPDNLADIRSVGDKVEGQELYEIPVLSVGKNLFKGNYEKDKYTTSNGVITNSADWCVTDFIECKPNTTYVQNHNIRLSTIVYCCFYDANKKFISSINESVYVTPSNCKYIRTSWKYSVGGFDFQLEEGTVATPYEPYQEDKLTILSPTPLEKVGNVADRIICKDGVWGVEKNVSEFFTFNGSESWIFEPKETSPSWVCNRYKLNTPLNILDGDNLISNKYTGGYTSNTIRYVQNGIYIFDLRNLSLEAFKVDMFTNNLKVKGVLSTPTFIPLPHDQQIKLRTFANKTNISFLTEIEGTIKAQVPKSLGATVNTHTEQINNLNKELDRVKKLEESTVSTVTTESDFTTVEATSNGYFEDVKLEGKTLVNEIGEQTELVCPKLNSWANISLPKKLKRNSVYTIIFNSKTKSKGYIHFREVNNTYISPATVIDFPIGINIVTTQINDAFTDGLGDKLTIYTSTGSENVMHINNILVLEGDHTQNPPNRCIKGLKSVGQSATTSEQDVEEVSVASVKGDGNLLEINSWVRGYVLPSGVVTENNMGCYYKEYVKCKPNTTYTLSNTKFINKKYIHAVAYDKNKQFIKTHVDIGNIPFTTDATTEFLRFYIRNDSDKAGINFSDIFSLTSFTIGNTVYTEYIPYQSDKKRLLYYNTETQTWEKPILRQWDSIEKHANGKYYYHVRSIEEDYVEGDEIVTDYITDMTTTVKPLSQEKVYECTNIDLITYNGETNFIVESGVLSPRTTLKVHSNISNVVSLLQKKVSLLESNVTSYMTTQNRLMLASRYNSDAVSFKVDYAVCSENMSQENYDTDLYNLILNNILVGKDNYDYDHMFNIIMDYASWSQISWDQFDILVGLMDIQHNPPIEKIPTDDEIVEEIPNEIM